MKISLAVQIWNDGISLQCITTRIHAWRNRNNIILPWKQAAENPRFLRPRLSWAQQKGIPFVHSRLCVCLTWRNVEDEHVGRTVFLFAIHLVWKLWRELWTSMVPSIKDIIIIHHYCETIRHPLYSHVSMWWQQKRVPFQRLFQGKRCFRRCYLQPVTGLRLSCQVLSE